MMLTIAAIVGLYPVALAAIVTIDRLTGFNLAEAFGHPLGQKRP